MTRCLLPLLPVLAGAAFPSAALASAASVAAAPAGEHYTLDPTHTFPSFEADHMGISRWRGKFNRSQGTLQWDRAAQRGTLAVTVDLDSVDFGLDALNDWARGAEFFDTARYPQAHYRGRLEGFRRGAPTRVEGSLELHGVTLPLTLRILSLRCIPHPIEKRELCGADAQAHIARDAFGLSAGKDFGFDMGVDLRIQVEALKDP